MSNAYSGETRISKILVWWFEKLDDDRGARAEIRRCTTPADVMMTRAFSVLLNALFPKRSITDSGLDGVPKSDIEALARTALIVGGARALDRSIKVPSAMVGSDPNGRLKVSCLRARNLFVTNNADEACRVLVTMRDLIGPFDPVDVFEAMCDWHQKRRDWCMNFNLQADRLARKAA